MSDEADETDEAADEDEKEGGSVLDGMLFEEGASSDDDGHDGLELDAQQAAEIRAIFLTSLPDYLLPIKEMVARLSSQPDESGEIRGGLAKTIASISAAAARMKLDDITQSMDALREDVVLFGDPAEPQEALRERISAALAMLDRLTGGTAAESGPEGRSETLVTALQGSDAVDNATLQKLLAAGLVYVKQVLDADPKEVAVVSGLNAATVAKIVRALETRAKSSPPREGAARRSAKPPAASIKPQNLFASHDSDDANASDSAEALGPFDDSGSDFRLDALPNVARGLVDVGPSRPEAVSDRPTSKKGKEASDETLGRLVRDELALEEVRGEATRLRATIEPLREDAADRRRQCDALRTAVAAAKGQAVARLTSLAKVEARRATLERDHAETLAELEKVTGSLVALESTRRATLDELASLTDDTASLAAHVTHGLETRSGS